jgi:hypothetical protein
MRGDGNVPLPRRSETENHLRTAFGLTAAITNDLHRFDTFTLEWREILPADRNRFPGPRAEFGFASLGTSLYVFGGLCGEVIGGMCATGQPSICT